LTALHGPPEVLDALPAALERSPAARAVTKLRTLAHAVERALAVRAISGCSVRVDLAEVRGLAYYTGPFFQFFADGPGVAIGGGGRYDGLLGRFGDARPVLPASGLALDVDAVAWARRSAGVAVARRPPMAIISAEIVDRDEIAHRLRSHGIVAVIAPEGDLHDFARDRGARVVVEAKTVENKLTCRWLDSSELGPLGVDEVVAAVLAFA
jgi:ATP phosphoribosyltransferase regulatory subunit